MTTGVKSAACWFVQVFPSGTHVVTDGARPAAGPWLHVVAYDTVLCEQDVDRLKYAMCEGLARFLNDGPLPDWLNDMERRTEDELVGADGTRVRACGPMYDADPPNLLWKQCEDKASKNARARLIDRLWLARPAA